MGIGDYSLNGERKTLFTIMAGLSSNSPCTKNINVKKFNVDSYVIAVGQGWQKRAYKCFAKSNNNTEALIAIDNVTQLIEGPQHQAELFACPHNPLIVITEIRLQCDFSDGRTVLCCLLCFCEKNVFFFVLIFVCFC